MTDVLEKLQNVDSAEDLSEFISGNMPGLHELYSSGWDALCKGHDSIEKFILYKQKLLAGLNYNIQENRAFLLILLDFSERLNLQSAIPHIIKIVNNNQNTIHLNKRLSAGISYIYPHPHNADEVLAKYNVICNLLQDAINTEEDNSNNSIITFLSYYSVALDLLSPKYATQLKERIESSLRSSEYPFLNEIEGLDLVDVADTVAAQSEIQTLIDSIIQKSIARHKPVPVDDFIIEKDTDYVAELNRVPCKFSYIKRLSDLHASGDSISGRGVNQIQNEGGLYDYMRNYGNMHKAKVLSALAAPFPQEFNSSLSIIDWGCGQGLASMVFMDKYGTNNIKQIILIEPSELALRRAALHCKKYAPDVPLQTINKEFDDLDADDIHIVDPEITIHLFSNVLDMENYSVEHLADVVKALPTSEQYFVCVSPQIDDIRTNKIDTFVRLMSQDQPSYNMISSKTNTKYNEFWNCNNMFSGYATSHGVGRYCRDSSGEPCGNRWTRVMRVFQV